MTAAFRVSRLCLVAGFLVGLACVASAQETDTAVAKARRKALLEGTHVFRRILHEKGFTPLTSFAGAR